VIGFSNRLFLVPGETKKCFSAPKVLPQSEISKLFYRVDSLMEVVKLNPNIPMYNSASEKWDKFYKHMKSMNTPYKKRLDTYALRLMPLLAVNNLKNIIDLEIVDMVIELVNWQLLVRSIYDPIDAEGKIARMEESIRRAFILQPEWTHRDLQRKVNYSRDGIWAWDAAIKNLVANNEIKHERFDNVYRKR